MDTYLYRKQPYQAGLANLALATDDSLPATLSSFHGKKKHDLINLQPKHKSVSSPSDSYKQPQQGRYKLHTEAMDLDSDYELDNAPVQSASRVTRRHPVKIPFLTPSVSSSTSSRKTISNNSIKNNKSDPTSPFYSTVVEPQMNLGQHWPPRSATFKKVIQGDNWHPIMTKKTPQTSLLKQMTAYLVDTYENQNPDYQYKPDDKPKRVLTKPSKAAKNDGFDNDDYDYILKVNDILGEEKEYQYRVIDLLGQGTFGQVVKCERITTGELFSVKVIKNKVAYREQSRMEVEILKQLKSKLDSKAQKHILTLHHTFTHKNHFCLVFELLSFNLYELVKQNQFKGLAINLVRVFALQLLDTLILLKEAKIIHCDLKPENILLTRQIIDFGSACHEANRIYTYIQSRFYRSPEVLLGLQYTGAIDMWSLGCIVAELFIGIPLFPGSSEYNQLRRIVDMLGMPPQDMLDKGQNSGDFFNKDSKGNGKYTYTMKSLEQYGMEHKKTELPGKKYYTQTELPDLILQTKSSHRSIENPKQDLEHRHAMIDFLQGLLELNPLKRWTPQQARHHPFVTGQPFTEPYNPNNLARKQGSVVKKSIKPTTLPTTQGGSSSKSQSATLIGELPPTKETIKPASDGESASRRPRAQSMNAPTLPSQMHNLILDMQAHPIAEHHPATQPAQPRDTSDMNQGWYKNRHARSQGDLVGLLSPENYHPQPSGPKAPANLESLLLTSEANTTPLVLPQASNRKVKIAPNVKIRIGSHEAYRQGDSSAHDTHLRLIHQDGSDWLTEPTLSSLQARPRPKGRLSHEGEAAGGLLMMRQQEKPDPASSSSSSLSSSKRVAAAIKRRTMLGN